MTMTEEQRDTVAFDPEKARASIAHYRIENPSNVDTESALKELVDQANLAEDALAEIERLRANEKSLSAILDRQVQEQAARIKSLKKEIRRLKHESKVEVKFTNSYIKRLHDAEARIEELEADLEQSERVIEAKLDAIDQQSDRIKALEDAMVEERTGTIRCESYDHCEGMYRIDLPDAMIRAQQELQAEGKIGLDAAKPRSWQITEERVGILEYCLETLLDAPDIEEIPGPGHSIEVLRAMLTEAGQ